jgi:hypothetical protein
MKKPSLWMLPAALGLAGVLSGFPLWLDAPVRNNPFDPKGADYRPSQPVFSPTDSFTISPTFSVSPTYSDTLTPSPSYSPSPNFTATATLTATPTPTISDTYTPGPAATDTFTPSPTNTPGSGGSCFSTPGTGPVGQVILYDDNYNGIAGGCASCMGGTWGAQNQTNFTSDFTNVYGNDIAPGDEHMNCAMAWTDGYYSGNGYRWDGWWDPAHQYDLANYDTLEFWVRGENGGEVAVNMNILCSTGQSSDFVLVDAAGTGGILGHPLSTTYEKVVIPLCSLTWAGATTTNMAGVTIFCNAPQAGAVTLYIDEMVFNKY